MSKMRRSNHFTNFRASESIFKVVLDSTYSENRKNKAGKVQTKEFKLGGIYPQSVYLYLQRCLDVDRDEFPSITEIAFYASMSEKNVKLAIKHLVKLGLIEKENRYTKNKEGKHIYDKNYYIIHFPEDVEGLEFKQWKKKGTSSEDVGGSVLRGPRVSSQRTEGQSSEDVGVSPLRANKRSFSNSTSSSNSTSATSAILKLDDYKEVNKRWVEVFQPTFSHIESLDPIEFRKLFSKAETDLILEILKGLEVYHDLSKVESPEAIVHFYIDKGGYVVPKKKKARRAKSSSYPSKKGNNEKIPSALVKQLEQGPKETAATGEKQETPEEEWNYINDQLAKWEEQKRSPKS